MLHHWPNPRVPWRSFHNHWIIKLVEHLNESLPEGFRARPTESIVGIEPDVLLLQAADQAETLPHSGPVLQAATHTTVLPPPADYPIVGIYSTYDIQRLVAAIELVSPGNKDRPAAVQAFVEKVVFLLQDGVHVTVVDSISLPRTSLRHALLKRLNLEEEANEAQTLWAAGYCSLPVEDPRPQIEVREWAYALQLNEPLPQVPLFLRKDQLWVPVDLQATYQETLRAGRYDPG